MLIIYMSINHLLLTAIDRRDSSHFSVLVVIVYDLLILIYL